MCGQRRSNSVSETWDSEQRVSEYRSHRTSGTQRTKTVASAAPVDSIRGRGQARRPAFIFSELHFTCLFILSLRVHLKKEFCY